MRVKWPFAADEIDDIKLNNSHSPPFKSILKHKHTLYAD